MFYLVVTIDMTYSSKSITEKQIPKLRPPPNRITTFRWLMVSTILGKCWCELFLVVWYTFLHAYYLPADIMSLALILSCSIFIFVINSRAMEFVYAISLKAKEGEEKSCSWAYSFVARVGVNLLHPSITSIIRSRERTSFLNIPSFIVHCTIL